MSATRWRKAGAVLSGAVTILLIAMVLLLAFFLLQSRLTGTEPSIVGHKIYIVMSGSMEPAVKMGGVVVVQPLPAEEVQPGDIITFRGENSRSLTTHRVVST
ncbi:MAG: signal peptidase I, partial [Dethiobacteria bacterium]